MTPEQVKECKTDLSDLVRKHGFFEVCVAAGIAPATLGVYLDDSNERYMSPKTMELASFKLA